MMEDIQKTVTGIPAIAIPLADGSLAWTLNGTYEAVEITVSPSGTSVRVAGVSRRCRRAMKCGFLVSPEDLDEFCRRWLDGRMIVKKGGCQ